MPNNKLRSLIDEWRAWADDFENREKRNPRHSQAVAWLAKVESLRNCAADLELALEEK